MACIALRRAWISLAAAALIIVLAVIPTGALQTRSGTSVVRKETASPRRTSGSATAAADGVRAASTTPRGRPQRSFATKTPVRVVELGPANKASLAEGAATPRAAAAGAATPTRRGRPSKTPKAGEAAGAKVGDAEAGQERRKTGPGKGSAPTPRASTRTTPAMPMGTVGAQPVSPLALASGGELDAGSAEPQRTPADSRRQEPEPAPDLQASPGQLPGTAGGSPAQERKRKGAASGAPSPPKRGRSAVLERAPSPAASPVERRLFSPPPPPAAAQPRAETPPGARASPAAAPPGGNTPGAAAAKLPGRGRRGLGGVLRAALFGAATGDAAPAPAAEEAQPPQRARPALLLPRAPPRPPGPARRCRALTRRAPRSEPAGAAQPRAHRARPRRPCGWDMGRARGPAAPRAGGDPARPEAFERRKAGRRRWRRGGARPDAPRRASGGARGAGALSRARGPGGRQPRARAVAARPIPFRRAPPGQVAGQRGASAIARQGCCRCSGTLGRGTAGCGRRRSCRGAAGSSPAPRAAAAVSETRRGARSRGARGAREPRADGRRRRRAGRARRGGARAGVGRAGRRVVGRRRGLGGRRARGRGAGQT